MAWKKRKRMRPGNSSITNDVSNASSAIYHTTSPDGSSSGVVPHNHDATTVMTCSLDPYIRGDERCLRIIKPYPFTFVTYAKARWVGRALLDVFNEEFGSYPKVYYEVAIKEGRISVNDNTVLLDYRIQGGDVIRHTVHRHEPAVLLPHKDRLIISETDEVIVVDKPPTLPIHPCGAYNLNSLFQILQEQQYGKLYTVHRLDRLTSGLTIIAKTPEVAKRLGKCISDRTSCEKVYLARVKGRFPTNFTADKRFQDCESNGIPCQFGETVQATGNAYKVSAEAAIGFWITDQLGNPRDDVTLQQMSESPGTLDTILSPSIIKHGILTDEQRVKQEISSLSDQEDSVNGQQSTQSYFWLNLACPCRISQPKNGVCETGDFASQQGKTGAKPAQTSFALVAYDEQTDSSAIVAKPLTGRTHQIRLHLQYLGHPIANDPNYGGEMFYNDSLGEQACAVATEKINIKEELKKRKQEYDNTGNFDETQGNPSSSKPSAANDCADVESTVARVIADTPATEDEIMSSYSQQRKQDESLLEYITRTCVWCARAGGSTAERTILEFLVRSQGIWLHALQYKLDGVTYRTNVPQWCILNK